MEFKTVGVIGKGIMGNGIIQVLAASGYKVLIIGGRNPAAPGSSAVIKKAFDKMVAKGRMTEEAEAAAMANIIEATCLEDAAMCDMVIEVISENLALKKDLYARLQTVCKPETIFASNTSSLSLTEMACMTDRPDKFIGMHFFNPVPAMKLVEIIRSLTTSDETYKAVYDLTLGLNKTPVEVKDNPGFVVNRILIPMINEAAFVLQEGVASAEDIDTAMKLGCNHPMGPLALGDLIGLDTCLSIMDVLYNNFGDSKYRAAYILRKMVSAGQLGRKSGKGFFDYTK